MTEAQIRPIGKAVFRPEIEGLRAVAALLVATYHIWLGRVSGGVDVFFVVSAFLVTTSLLGHLDANGRVHFVKFWGGLLKRLLPAALLVLLAVVAASVIWMPTIRWADTIKEVIASALYVENWQLARNAVDYLAQGSATSPVQHYWALSIQGQFYVAWPLLLMLVAYIAHRRGTNPRRLLPGTLAALFAISLAYSVTTTRSNQAFAYFDTFARLWEFSLGAMVALLLPLLKLQRWQRVLLGWAGLVAIVSCGLVLQVSKVFPGYAALWPTLGAIGIILAGTTGSTLGADRLLASKPLRYLGGISYSIYLWHWPMLVFYRILSGNAAVGLFHGLLLLGGSIMLAALTTWLIERPVRSSAIGVKKPWQSLAMAAAGLAVVFFSVGAWSMAYRDARAFDRRSVALDDPDYPGALAAEEGFVYRGGSDVPYYPGPLAVRNDVPKIYPDGCHQNRESPEPLRCEYGDRTAARTIALVGGSHSAQWLPALEVIAEAQPWRIVTYSKGSCRFSAEMVQAFGKDYPSCVEWNDRVMAELLRDRPEIVFTTSTTAIGLGQTEHTPAGFLTQWSKLESAGIRVVAVRDNPWFMFNVAECVESQGIDSPACTRPRDAVLATVSPVDQLNARPTGVLFIDLSRYFCNETECPPVMGNIMIYRDDNHISSTYAKTLAPVLLRELKQGFPDLFTP